MSAAAEGGPGVSSFFEGIPDDELDDLQERLPVRRYPAGTVIIGEGDRPRELYVIRSGTAEVFVTDRQGVEHRVGRLGPGTTAGEMSLFSGQPAAGTVRAADDVDAVVVAAGELERLGTRFPLLYRNLGAILSERLARTNLLALPDAPGRLSLLDDRGAPPLLGYALASSVAWHTQGSTLLLVLDESPHEELARLSLDPDADALRPSGREPPAARVMVAAPEGAYAPGALAGTLEEVCSRFGHVLVQGRGDPLREVAAYRRIGLAAAGAANGDTAYTLAAWGEAGPRVGPDSNQLLRVAPLTQADEEALATGLLPPATGAGKALGWAARDLAGLKVGVALGAGSVRGFAHIGVLRALERAGVTADYIAGTSVGAAVASVHALGYSADEQADLLFRCGAVLFRPRISTRSFLSSRAFRKFLLEAIGEIRIEETQIPLATVAADLATQREIVFRNGFVWQAVLASTAIPGVYPAEVLGRYTVVDGGVLDPVPSGVVAEMGADVVIGVRLGIRQLAPDMDVEAVPAKGRPPSAISVIMRAIEIMQSRVAAESGGAATIMIRPELGEIPSARLRSFAQGVSFVDDGDASAQAALPRLAAALPWLR